MDSAAQSIVSKLGQLAVDELKNIRGVGDKVVHLIDELSTMNAVLRMISEADQSTVDHLMREWEKQVRELAYDAEDCTDIYRLRVNRALPPSPSFSARYVATWAKYRLQKLLLQRRLAADVKALLARTCAVSERRARYGIDQVALTRSPWFAPTTASANALSRVHDPEQFVGIREQAAALAERIKAKDDNDKTLKVFSIVGFGGLGKTTLAVELCRQLEADFQRQALVSVSQAFDAEKDMKGLLQRVLRKILELKDKGRQEKVKDEGCQETQGNRQLDINKIEEMDVDGLSSNLKEQLTGKRFLIVIDDVWSLSAWEAIHIRLPENNCGSRIIVTTRGETVAKASSVSEDLIHHMKPLGKVDSEKLFVKRVFGSVGGICPNEVDGICPNELKDPNEVDGICPNEVDGICPNEVKECMVKILKKCGGLPLAIVSTASLLAGYNSAESIEMWISVSKSIGCQMESHPTLEQMRQVITLRYEYLPHHLKACMMYLSTFPEDDVIAKDRLLYRWIAEGLVAEKQGLTLYDVAEEYFNDLIARNMIQPEKLVVNRTLFTWEEVEACRRLSVHGNDCNKHVIPNKNELEQRHRETMNLQQVRSLSTFQSEGLERLLGRVHKFELLRVLDLEGCKALQNKHMKGICKLYLLRYMSLRSTPISVMPSEIGNLEYLETLDVEGTLIRDMPSTVEKLSKLELLRVPRWIRPHGIGNLKALRELSCVELNDEFQAARDIGELQQLQVLYLYLNGASKELFDLLASSLSKTCALRSLHLYGSAIQFPLNVSSPPPLIRRLRLINMGKFPDWISSLKHLVEIKLYGLEDASGQVILQSLSKLPSLQRMELVCYYGQGGGGAGELIARTHDFQALSNLDLYFTPGYPKVFTVEEGSMTKLETLLLCFYRDMETSIVGIENLKNLKEVKLRCWDGSPSLERAVEQLKLVNENRNSNQIKLIKVVVESRW